MKIFVLSGIALLSAPLALATPAVAASSTPVHQQTVAHSTLPVNATWHVRWDVQTREVNPVPVARGGMPACRWDARATVTRDVRGADGQSVAALAKPIHSFDSLSGVQPGSCAAARPGIDSRMARVLEPRESAAATLAQRDVNVLVAELDGVASLMKGTGQGG